MNLHSHKYFMKNDYAYRRMIKIGVEFSKEARGLK